MIKKLAKITPGRLLYQFRLRSHEGWTTPYWRDVVRPRILETLPVSTAKSSLCEIHTLTSQQDWLNLIWALKSFYFYSQAPYSLCIHEDGTLTQDQIEMLQSHFPNARLVTRAEADERMHDVLARRPRSGGFRQNNPLALKVFDFGEYLQADRLLLLDSDILFFAAPGELLRRIDDKEYRLNSLNKDWGFGYTVEPEKIQPQLDFMLLPNINSGLGLIQRAAIDFERIEAFLNLPNVIGHPHRIEQTLIALYCCRFGFEFLPAEYDVRISDGKPSHPCRHYTGPIRHFMYRLGMRYLLNNGFLEGAVSDFFIYQTDGSRMNS